MTIVAPVLSYYQYASQKEENEQIKRLLEKYHMELSENKYGEKEYRKFTFAAPSPKYAQDEDDLGWDPVEVPIFQDRPATAASSLEELKLLESYMKDHRSLSKLPSPFISSLKCFFLYEIMLLISSLVTFLAVRVYCEWTIFGIKWLLETKKAALLIIEGHNIKTP